MDYTSWQTAVRESTRIYRFQMKLQGDVKVSILVVNLIYKYCDSRQILGDSLLAIQWEMANLYPPKTHKHVWGSWDEQGQS